MIEKWKNISFLNLEVFSVFPLKIIKKQINFIFCWILVQKHGTLSKTVDFISKNNSAILNKQHSCNLQLKNIKCSPTQNSIDNKNMFIYIKKLYNTEQTNNLLYSCIFLIFPPKMINIINKCLFCELESIHCFSAENNEQNIYK